MKKLLNSLNWFEWLMTAGVTIASIFAITRGDDQALLSSFAAITGIICVILCAKGKRSSYIWGFVNVIAYATLAYRWAYYGEVALNALYFMPTQFIGWFYWSKHLNIEVNEVKAKVMGLKEIIIWSIATLVTMYVVYQILGMIGAGFYAVNQDGVNMAGAMSLTLSLVANILMVKRYAEQWPLWIIVNVASIYLWISAGDIVQTTMWSMYLINAIYGWYLWVQMKKNKNPINE